MGRASGIRDYVVMVRVHFIIPLIGLPASFLKIIVRVKRAIRLKKMIQRDWS
jgi:hypothetical protein